MKGIGSVATRPFIGRWLIVALTFIGFLGQVALQGLTAPDESPRAAILRLTGIDISPTVAPSAHAATHDMKSMPMDHGMEAGPQHAMPVHAQPGGKDSLPKTGHHHDADCPLCPLLLIFGILLGSATFLPAISTAWLSMRRILAQPRAPPAFTLALPPATGPPLLF
ncbi:DUF2946 family protein [Acetobacter conturbans]|uniref:DUF2946 domain-containing protein n=1 Tax=Acetobacter conturbans TaxID=1737472 RepID=A0ABX0JYH3_9PROT|nr:DUF2946 family protein [Acetobacter conturbans]NHN87490.1 DUF2946 domain-containing protein [Acetobacter conturbans]